MQQLNLPLIQELKSKHVFFDIDGTLSEYRFAGHVNWYTSPNPDPKHCITFREQVSGGIFRKARPLQTMISTLAQFDPERLYILGAFSTGNEIFEKLDWLKEYYPFILKSHCLFVNNSKLKITMLGEQAERLRVSRDSIVLIDDKHETLELAEVAGFLSYHVTSFMP